MQYTMQGTMQGTMRVEPWLRAPCIELGFPPKLETTELDVDERTTKPEEEDEAVIDYRDASTEDDIVATEVSPRLTPKQQIPCMQHRTLKLQQRESERRRPQSKHRPRNEGNLAADAIEDTTQDNDNDVSIED